MTDRGKGQANGKSAAYPSHTGRHSPEVRPALKKVKRRDVISWRLLTDIEVGINNFTHTVDRLRGLVGIVVA